MSQSPSNPYAPSSDEPRATLAEYGPSFWAVAKFGALCTVSAAVTSFLVWKTATGGLVDDPSLGGWMVLAAFPLATLVLAWATLSTAQARVSLDDEGITRHSLRGAVRLRWADVASVKAQRFNGQLSYLLVGVNGQEVSFGDDLRDFEGLRDRVQERVDLPKLARD